MSHRVPQHSDIELHFHNIMYTPGSSEVIDLSTVDEIVLSIAKMTKRAEPVATIRRSQRPEAFKVQPENKMVAVKVSSTELANGSLGRYFTNLWFIIGDKKITHLRKTFEVVPSVKPLI